MAPGLPLPPVVRGVLGEGRQAHVAVASRHGPHVTPELYAWSGGRLWFAAASTTLKAKVLRKDPSVAVLVPVAGRSVVLTGEVEVLDPLRPGSVLRGLPRLPGTLRAVANYGTRNAVDLAAFVGDTVTGRLGWGLPPHRVLFSVEPRRVALVENDVLVGHWGWDLDGQPTAGDAVPSGGVRAVAAFPGPVALPCRWFEQSSQVHLPPALAPLVDLGGRVPMSVVVDDYSAPGPAAKRGALVRGEGRVVDGAPVTIAVERDRVVEWDGVRTTSR